MHPSSGTCTWVWHGVLGWLHCVDLQPHACKYVTSRTSLLRLCPESDDMNGITLASGSRLYIIENLIYAKDNHNFESEVRVNKIQPSLHILIERVQISTPPGQEGRQEPSWILKLVSYASYEDQTYTCMGNLIAA